LKKGAHYGCFLFVFGECFDVRGRACLADAKGQTRQRPAPIVGSIDQRWIPSHMMTKNRPSTVTDSTRPELTIRRAHPCRHRQEQETGQTAALEQDAIVISSNMRSNNSIATAVALLALVACCWVIPGNAYRYTVFVGSSTAWAPPPGASDISVTLWGGGGGGASTAGCGAGGGSGATILNRTVDDSQWGVAPSDVVWEIVVGEGGAAYDPPFGSDYTEGSAGDGGATSVYALHPNGTVLASMRAYGGGGAYAKYLSTRRGCQGGAGGGASSSAVGTTPGGGLPSGGADQDPAGPPGEGALVGDIKAGGAGAGAGYQPGVTTVPYRNGADWTVGSRHFTGGMGSMTTACISWGGAAGYGGNGGHGSSGGLSNPVPAANSGAGGGSAYVCAPTKYNEDAAGASGGVIVEYNHPVAPSPSPTPSRSPTPSVTPTPTRTPSVTPSPSSQPLTQTGVWFISSVNDKNLTPQDDGSVRSLWYDPSYHSKWTVARLSNGKYTFKSTYKNCFLTGHASSPDGYVRCESSSPGTLGQWTILIGPDNQWTFKSVHGTYMGTTAAGVLYLNQNSGLYWTKYPAA
jgi:hypothetical protein